MLLVRRWSCVLLLAAVLACRRNEPAAIQRVAILPLENLSGDSSADWIGPAAANLAATAATGGGRMHPFAAATRADALRARATRIVAGYYVVRQGVVSLRAVDEVVSTATNRPLEAETPLTTGILPLVETLARGIGANVRALPAVNTEAVRLYGLALLAVDPGARAERLDQALELDPAFTLARLDLADVLTARGDRPAAQKVLAESPGAAGILIHRVAMRRADLASDIDAWIAAARSALDFH
ncbi:MAG: tetratricopeptide repeat protein, partial [Bryobacteraceae bacterium]